MSENHLRQLEARGVSVWLDGVTRGEITGGAVLSLIDDDGISGITTNPSTFEKAVTTTTDYDQDIQDFALQGWDARQIVDTLVVDDVQALADELRPLWDRTNGQAGFVSVEVSPHLARDTQGTIQEVHRLWALINRPNLMVKIPGTVEGVGAIRQCLVDGLNINITLLFSLERYAAVVEAYLDAIETRLVQGQSVESIASVASFFVSRVDTIVDRAIRQKLSTAQDGATRTILENLLGKIGVANARLAYQHFRRVFDPSDVRWDKLAGACARVQQPLWASTSMKEAGRRDTLYLEELIAPNVVITAPLATLNAFRDHGQVRGDTAAEGFGVAEDQINSLAEVGIDFPLLLSQLEDEGVKLFADAWDRLLVAVEEKARRFKSAA